MDMGVGLYALLGILSGDPFFFFIHFQLAMPP